MEAKEYFNITAEEYDKEFSETSIWNIAHRVAWKLLNSKLPEAPEKVLDTGCGTGQWGRIFARAGSHVTFTDISERMVEEAVSLLEKEGISETIDGKCLSVDDLNMLDDSSFDLTLCMGDPLSYCYKPYAGIEELVRVTRKGGHIFTSVDSRLGYLRVFKERDGYDLDALERYIESGEIRSWEDLNIHTFRPDELKERFLAANAECLGIWQLPMITSYFIFDPAFREKLKDRKFRDRIEEIEMKAVDWGHAPGSHHLYGLFRRIG